jgi:hypothetical protein
VRWCFRKFGEANHWYVPRNRPPSLKLETPASKECKMPSLCICALSLQIHVFHTLGPLNKYCNNYTSLQGIAQESLFRAVRGHCGPLYSIRVFLGGAWRSIGRSYTRASLATVLTEPGRNVESGSYCKYRLNLRSVPASSRCIHTIN